MQLRLLLLPEVRQAAPFPRFRCTIQDTTKTHAHIPPPTYQNPNTHIKGRRRPLAFIPLPLSVRYFSAPLLPSIGAVDCVVVLVRESTPHFFLLLLIMNKNKKKGKRLNCTCTCRFYYSRPRSSITARTHVTYWVHRVPAPSLCARALALSPSTWFGSHHLAPFHLSSCFGNKQERSGVRREVGKREARVKGAEVSVCPEITHPRLAPTWLCCGCSRIRRQRTAVFKETSSPLTVHQRI